MAVLIIDVKELQLVSKQPNLFHKLILNLTIDIIYKINLNYNTIINTYDDHH